MSVKRNFNFLGIAGILTPLSCGLSFLALIAIFVLGFNYGIDFAGGNEFQIRFEKPVIAERIRTVVREAGMEDPLVQSFGKDNEFIIRVEVAKDEKENTRRLSLLKQTLEIRFQDEGVQIRRIDSIGPQIGKELRRNGILAIVYSLLMILIYLGLRFDIKYAPAAVFCLFHDTVITLSVFALFNLEVNAQTLAGILAIIGYSLNDTIVTFDRIRENHAVFQNKKSFFEVCNQSLNDVLSRTLLTSLTTLLAVSAMWLIADGAIKDFAFTLAVGVTVGTYSSIYVATPLLIFMNRFKVFQ